jgi:glutathione S-transferase
VRIDALGREMAGALDRFEAMLDGRPYLLGPAFSAADCAAYPFLKYALWRDPADDELFHRILDGYQQLGDDHPRLAAWIERVDERPRV